ncbi:unnamed protein product (macronuclear) [Paramecium tetraurelia]|uniref:Actin, cytoplasmic n=1 Tax=Paramecium tetraurelia TaxID=5888 RepID=A0D932_PARTE|nr:uncharacterized protein GSPATT00014495001 [Paramecium tetraurelia]CAK79549.1 unnamed protein product [Paramecium tetraurelia]|eukprot:XP_001446946.1 hypothetical protein (macronuclear) [Paramecium tetraurelia strain d4-2]
MKNQPVVIDNGSGSCRVGLSWDQTPSHCFPAVVGKPKKQGIMIGMDSKDVYVGDEALALRRLLNIQSPFENGIIKNWEDMERIWQYAINELRVNPEDHPVLLTEPMFFQESNREKMIQVFFETFKVPKFQVHNEAALALYSSGRITGFVVSCGESCTYTIPIYEGKVLSYAALRICLGGNACTEYFVRILTELGLSFESSTELEIARDIKEKLCYVALDYEEEMKIYKESKAKNKHYELPDGNIIVIEDQRFRCPELLFKPKLIGFEVGGIDELTHKQILKCQEEIRDNLYKNIVLSGGTSLFPGLEERLRRELYFLVLSKQKIKIVAYRERFQEWIGGQILSSLSYSENMWITRREYDENGPTIVHRKCQTVT